MERNYGSEIGLMGIIQIVLIILKITNCIDYSWWIVLIPLEFDFAIFCSVLIFLLGLKIYYEFKKRLK